jgi:hypothetical protein
MFRGYDAIKALAKARGVRVADLLVLAEKNDPFYAGSPAQRAKAEWFAELWRRFGYTSGVHLRRVHYRLVSGDERHGKHDAVPSTSMTRAAAVAARTRRHCCRCRRGGRSSIHRPFSREYWRLCGDA